MLEEDPKAFRDLIAKLRSQVEFCTPPKKEAALERLEELEVAILSASPEVVTTAKYVERWFQKNVPALANAVASVISSPVAKRLVGHSIHIPVTESSGSEDKELQRSIAGDALRITISGNAQNVTAGKALTQVVRKGLDDTRALRGLWHNLIRNHGFYRCCATPLILPSDKEAIRYFSRFDKEVDLISGESCLVIVFGDMEVNISQFNSILWNATLTEHIYEGYSTKIAQLFRIGFDKFPCLVLFRDIRSSDHVIVALQGLSVEEIAEKMRTVFSIIQEAVSKNESPLNAVVTHRDRENLLNKGRSVVSELQNLAGKTLETAVEAWMKSTFK